MIVNRGIFVPKLDEFAFLDATAQADLVRRKEVKPIELVEAAISRIKVLNPLINAVITPMYEQARTAAIGKLPDGPFKGVPFLLKDILAEYAGVPMTSGAGFMRNYVPDFDNELVIRYKKAGLVILGKTNLPEFGPMFTTEPMAFGPCRNPWNTERLTGGSSGGSAAAVAAGMVSAAHGNDGGGSIRVPSASCGVFGLKTTRARNPMGPADSFYQGDYIVDHVITRTVRDSAALLDATCGPDIGAPYWAPPPARPFIEEVGADPGKLKIAFTMSSSKGALHPDCVTAMKEAVSLCADLGHEMVEASPNVDLLPQEQAYKILAQSAFGMENAAKKVGKKLTSDIVEPSNWQFYELGRNIKAFDYLSSSNAIRAICRKIAHFWTKYDIWLTPVNTEPAPKIGEFFKPDRQINWDRMGRYAPYCTIFNWTGQPAMSVPLFWNSEGMPIGVQFVGKYADEATLFRLASQLEKAMPWAWRIPPTSKG